MHQLIWRTMADLLLAGRQLSHAAPQAPTLTPNGTTAVSSSTTVGWPTRIGRWLGVLRAAEDPDMGPSEWEEGVCVFCGASPPHTVQTAPCGHVCCYFCVARARMSSRRARCPRCAVRLDSG